MDERELLSVGLDYHKKGELPAAADVYKELIRRNPDHAHALYLLGCLVRNTGNHLAAIDLLRRALAVSPKVPEYHHALALALIDSENYGEADSSLRRAIRLSSRPEFHNAMGVLQRKEGRLPEAIASFRHALKQDPAFAEAHYNLGNSHRLNGALEQAADSFRRAVAADGKFGYALAALGETLRLLKRSAEAIPYLEQAVELNPQDAELNYILGSAYHDAGQLSQAISAYHTALRSNPHLARAWYSVGCAELTRKEYVAAISYFEKALAEAPDWLEAEHNLARALFELGQTERALTHFRNCAARKELANSAGARGMVALIIPGAPNEDNSSILAARRAWAECDLACRDAFPTRPRPSEPGDGRLRIGYISSFFHRENWMKPVGSLIKQHDRSVFDIFVFSAAPASAMPSGYHLDSRDHFHDISRLGNEEVNLLIRRCRVDILIDLNGYSDMQRLPLFVLRPAPVIAGWFNLYATSGLYCFDYLIGDKEVISVTEEHFYSERICRVSGSYLTFEVGYPVPEVADPPCIANHTITFGSLASQIKITDRVVAAWSSILSRSPASSLIVRNGVLGSVASREFLHSMFAGYGIPRDRIRLEGPLEHFDFLRAYNEIDVALDTFPYNGGTTTTEAIWQGVPVVTFWGDRWVSRTSASILRAGGLSDFVRANVEDYIGFAVDLAKSPETPERLLALRRGMRAQLKNSRVCDTRAFAREMEMIYQQIQCREQSVDPGS
jgi:protein O-GlcNAc transferase